jgi:hypothetical protein
MKKVYWVSISQWGLFPWVALPPINGKKPPSYATEAGPVCDLSMYRAYTTVVGSVHPGAVVDLDKKREEEEDG